MRALTLIALFAASLLWMGAQAAQMGPERHADTGDLTSAAQIQLQPASQIVQISN